MNRRTSVLASTALVAGLIVALLGVVSLPAAHGPSWRDDGPDGHSRFIEHLAQEHHVRVLQSSLGLLPSEAGPGDVLYLFPAHRPPAQAEIKHVADFVARGGVLVMAANGAHGTPWAESFGVRFQGLPALSPDPQSESGCIGATLRAGPTERIVCLPSPTAFPNVTRLMLDEGEFDYLGNTTHEVFLDTTLNGRLSRGDQGPLRLPVILQWRHGEGVVVAIADGNLWRNGFIATQNDDRNLQAARALADVANDGGTIYVDSSAARPAGLQVVTQPMARTLAAPDPPHWAAVVVLLAGIMILLVLMPRASRMRKHEPPMDAEDARVRREGLELLQKEAEYAQVATQNRHSRSHDSRSPRGPQKGGKSNG